MATKERSLFDGDLGGEQWNQDMHELNDIFSKFKEDPDFDFISVNRLTEVIQALGRNPSLKDSEERIHELELIGKYELTLDDVLQILDEPWTVMNNDRDGLRQALANFDHAQKGYIDIEQFRTAMRTLGEPLSEKELDELIQLGLDDHYQKINIDYLLDQLLGHSA